MPVMRLVAPGALAWLAGATIALAALLTGGVSCWTDEMQGVVTHHAGDLRSITPGTGRGLQAARQWMPIQGEAAFTLAAFEREFKTLYRADELEALL